MSNDTEVINDGNIEVKTFKRVLRMTLNNTLNLNRRLKRRDLISNSILIYYSLYLIIQAVTVKFFNESFNMNLVEYFNIVISIVLVVFSLINLNAGYGKRIHISNDYINRIREIRKTINIENYNNKSEEYSVLANELERRTDGDFFKTLKNECRQNNTHWLGILLMKNANWGKQKIK